MSRYLQIGALIAIGISVGAPAVGSGRLGGDQNPDVERLPLSPAVYSVARQSPHTASRSGASADVTTAPADRPTPKPPGTAAPSRAELTVMVERLAQRHRLDLDLVHALIRAESAYNPHAVSPVGAVGLMQVMPATASDYGVASVDALFDPSTNLDTGMRHLKRLLDKYGNIGHAVMAYNAGEGALDRSGGFVTYPETQRYTHAVLVSYLQKKGVQPYTARARQAVGMDVTPAMALAAAGSGGVGAAPDVAQAASKPPQRVPVTRLTSRLSPGLSRRSDVGPTGLVPSASAPSARNALGQTGPRAMGSGR